MKPDSMPVMEFLYQRAAMKTYRCGDVVPVNRPEPPRRSLVRLESVALFIAAGLNFAEPRVHLNGFFQ